MHRIRRLAFFYSCTEVFEHAPRVFIGSASSSDRMRTTTALAHRLQKEFAHHPQGVDLCVPADREHAELSR